MISWIRGELINSWIKNQKSFVLINCQGIGYEIQTSSLLDNDSKKDITLWIHLIKREDSDTLYGFKIKDERDFFRDLISVKGIGPQIGMSLLNKYSLNQVINSLLTNDRDLINSVPGIGKKMTERIFLELSNKITKKDYIEQETNKINFPNKSEIKILIEDIKIALKSLDYSKKDIQETISLLLNDFIYDNDKKDKVDKLNFEELFKKSLKILENN